MLALREEVEQEYAERMEELRNMYRDEMDAQNEKCAKDRDKARELEKSLSETLKVKREEADTYRTKANDLEQRVNELSTRLDNQTAEVIRLQAELEEYEYGRVATKKDEEDEDEEESEYEEAEEHNDSRQLW